MPLRSLAAAKEAAAQFAGKEAVTVNLSDGVYYLVETLVFSPKESGTAEYPVTYRAVNEGKAVLSGGVPLDLTWEPYRDGIFQAQMPAGLEIDQLYINGEQQRMARYPNHEITSGERFFKSVRVKLEQNALRRVESLVSQEGVYVHAADRSGIGAHHRRVKGLGKDGELIYEGIWSAGSKMGYHEAWSMIENAYEELDVAGEWYHNHNQKTQTLLFKPAEGVDLNAAEVVGVRLPHFVEFRGSAETPVKHITFQHLVVRHAARTFMGTKEPLSTSYLMIFRGGAFLLNGTENIQILDTEFAEVGGNAIFVSNYNRNAFIRGCHIHSTGASSICFVGDPKATRNPSFSNKKKGALSELDLEVGPVASNYPAQSTVEDCLIHDIGQTESMTFGVLLSMSQGITVRNCSIYNTASSGISVNDGTWGGHLIEGCDVFDNGLKSSSEVAFSGGGRSNFS